MADNLPLGAGAVSLASEEISAGVHAFRLAGQATPRWVEVTLSLTADANADNDVFADTQVVADAFRVTGVGARLTQIVVLEEDDVAPELDIVFLGADVSLGTESAAVSITDANARNIQHIENIAVAAYVDFIASMVATKPVNSGRGVYLTPIAATKNLAVGVILRTDAITPSASGVRLRLCFED